MAYANEHEEIAAIHRMLSYDPETGVIMWRVRRAGISQKKPAGHLGKFHGYRVICVAGKLYYGHRLAWLLHHGAWPSAHVDHINGDRGDNRLINLRLATNTENIRNSRLSRANTSGFKGVIWDEAERKWMARICVDRRTIHLGRFDTVEAAARQYDNAARMYFGQFAKTNAELKEA